MSPFASAVSSFALPALVGLLVCSATGAQGFIDRADWKESAVPPPPVFDLGKLVTFKISADSALVYGVDPASITISKSDSLVRYVMVATSSSGATNIMYEALRCATGEFKTYARYSAGAKWSLVQDPQWKSVFDTAQSRHALRFARQGACDGGSPALTVQEIVSNLKSPEQYKR